MQESITEAQEGIGEQPQYKYIVVLICFVFSLVQPPSF